MPDANLDSALLASTDPERLHRWYADALSPDDDTKEGPYRILRFGRFHLLIDGRDDVEPRNPDPARVILNLDVRDARAVVARLDEVGTTWIAPLEDRDGSLFATAADPDGNSVQLIQLSAEHRAEMAAGPDGPLAGAIPFTTVAVADLDAARSFYGEVLGLRVTDEPMGLLRLHLYGQDVVVYPKADHVPATSTVLNFAVPDVGRTVEALAERGVRFERYEGFDQDERGIARGEGPTIAWFTDPSGNICSVVEEGASP